MIFIFKIVQMIGRSKVWVPTHFYKVVCCKVNGLHMFQVCCLFFFSLLHTMPLRCPNLSGATHYTRETTSHCLKRSTHSATG
jgi:hypothetical protein